MPMLNSKYRTGLDNLSIDLSLVKKIQLGKPYPANPRLWIIYFWGEDENLKEKVVRTWFYSTELDREMEWKLIREKYQILEA